jgi:hypothetical protein
LIKKKLARCDDQEISLGDWGAFIVAADDNTFFQEVLNARILEWSDTFPVRLIRLKLEYSTLVWPYLNGV